MLGEKKSFRRFLSVYIISSLFLLGAGSYVYYKMSYQLILNTKITQMKKEIDIFIMSNKKSRFLKMNTEPEYLDIPMAIYIDQKYKLGNFQLQDIDLKKEVIKKKSKLYYIHKEHKKWADIYFITYKSIKDDVQNLIQNLILFFLFSTLFIIAIASVLGKIFLKPMKDTLVSLENFIMDATHEINTPISNILINIELSKELYPNCGNTDEFKKIENSAFRISKIFKDLSFLRLEHQATKKVEELHINQLLNERIDFFMSFIEAKKLDLSQDIHPLKLSIDKEDAIRLIDNLLSNAIKYSPEDSTIQIILNRYFEVINEGKISDKEKVLEKFVRDNTNEGGFGLGLYIVQKICKNYNYRFTLSSSNAKVFSKIDFI